MKKRFIAAIRAGIDEWKAWERPYAGPALQAPWPAIGGKAKIAPEVWRRFGKIDAYLEPFCHSAAVLLNRPCIEGIEIINDINPWPINAYRAIRMHHRELAKCADWPMSDITLKTWNGRLIAGKESLVEKLISDPEYCDAELAKWWLWGNGAWFGSGWGYYDAIPRMNIIAGCGVLKKHVDRLAWFKSLADRLRHVRMCCGDWKRICTPGILRLFHELANPITGVFLDPPYVNRQTTTPRKGLYENYDPTIAVSVAAWAAEMGSENHVRIAICGMDGDYPLLKDWECYSWQRSTGWRGKRLVNDRTNGERIWFSPSCLTGQQELF